MIVMFFRSCIFESGRLYHHGSDYRSVIANFRRTEPMYLSEANRINRCSYTAV